MHSGVSRRYFACLNPLCSPTCSLRERSLHSGLSLHGHTKTAFALWDRIQDLKPEAVFAEVSLSEAFNFDTLMQRSQSRSQRKIEDVALSYN